MENNYLKLISDFKNGDAKSAEELYTLTVSKIFNIAYSIIGSKHTQNAEDIVQESYLYAFKNINQLNDGAKFESWLCKITANKAKDYLSKYNPRLFSSLNDENAGLWNEDRFFDMSFNEYQNNMEKSQIVMSIINSLTDEQRLCIIMYYYDEMSVAEIADTFNIPQGTVKSRLYNARQAIKEQAEELERKGTKLYGLGIGPSIFAALNTNAQIIQPSTMLAQKVFSSFNGNITLQSAGLNSAPVKNINVQQAAVSVVKKSFPLWGKIIAAAAAVVIAAAGITAAVVLQNNNPTDLADTNSNVTLPTDNLSDTASQQSQLSANTHSSSASDDKIQVVKNNSKGLKAEIISEDIAEDILSSANIKKSDVDSINAYFLTQNVIKVNIHLKNYTHQDFLYTTDGKKIEAGNFADVRSNPYTSYERNIPYDYSGCNDLFCISYNGENKDYNTYGLMDKSGKMIIKDEYAYIGVISSTFAVAYKAQKTNNGDEWCPHYTKLSNEDYYNATGIVDVYNIKTGKKIDKLCGIKRPDGVFYANDEIVCLEYYGMLDVVAYDKDGKEYDYINNYDQDKDPVQILDLNPPAKPVTLAIKEEGDDKAYLTDKKGNNVSEQYKSIIRINDYFITTDDNGKQGIIAPDGQIISQCKFDSILIPSPSDISSFRLFEYGICGVMYNEKIAFINLKGEFVTEPTEFSRDAENYDSDLIMVNSNKELLTPAGKINFTSDKDISIHVAVASNQGTFIVKETDSNYNSTITLYDFMSNPLMEISGGVYSDISVNLNSSFALISNDNDKKLVLYKISQY